MHISKYIYIYMYKGNYTYSITYDILTLCQCISSLHFTRITGNLRDLLLAKDYHTAFAEALAPGISPIRFAQKTRKAVKLVVFILHLADDNKIRSDFFCILCGVFFNSWLEWWMFLYVFVNLFWMSFWSGNVCNFGAGNLWEANKIADSWYSYSSLQNASVDPRFSVHICHSCFFHRNHKM